MSFTCIILDIVCILQKFYPQAELTNFCTVRVYINPKQTVFYNCTLFFKESFLYQLAFCIIRVVTQFTVSISYYKLIILNVYTITKTFAIYCL